MYEWEREVSISNIKTEAHRLREEIKRVSTVTLRGNFAKEEDREYWVKKLNEMNGKLSALEEAYRV